MKHLAIPILFLLISCNSADPGSIGNPTDPKYDTSYWRADQIFMGKDTIDLNANHIIYQIRDTCISAYYFKNDSLKRNYPCYGCIGWRETQDTLFYPITCTNYHLYPIKSYNIINSDKAFYEGIRVFIPPSYSYILDSSGVIINRLKIRQDFSQNMQELFSEFPDSCVIVN